MPVFEGVSWSSTGSAATVTWSFAATNFPMNQYGGYVAFESVVPDFYKAGVRAAFQSWSSVANINFIEVADSASAQIRLGNHELSGATGDGGVLGETLYWFQGSKLMGAEILFDPDAYSPATFYAVAEHEIGHAIGLEHSASPSNIMYFATTPANASGALSADDIQGAQTLYGVRGSAQTPSTPAPPASTPAGSNDVWRSSNGNERYDGGDGVDNAMFYGTRGQYNITRNGNTIVVSDTFGNRDGTDTLVNVEQVQFSDVTLIFDLNTPQARNVYLLYQAVAGRMPDLTGFRYWAQTAVDQNLSTSDLVHSFWLSPEFQSKFGGLNNPDFAFGIYSNVLGRRPDQAGWDFWTNALNRGYTREQMLADFAQGQENAAMTASHMDNGFWVV